MRPSPQPTGRGSPISDGLLLGRRGGACARSDPDASGRARAGRARARAARRARADAGAADVGARARADADVGASARADVGAGARAYADVGARNARVDTSARAYAAGTDSDGGTD